MLFIEAAFISPAVGERYRDKLDRLGRDIGWRLKVSQVTNMNAILDAARKLLEGRTIRKGPSFQSAERKIRVTLDSRPPPEEREKRAAEFRELTGFDLEEKSG